MVFQGWTVNRICNVGGFLRLSLDEMYLTDGQEGVLDTTGVMWSDVDNRRTVDEISMNTWHL